MAAVVDTQKLQDLGLLQNPAATSKKKDELGQDAFLKLMTTQLKNQDPMKPMDDGAFLGQIAQFAQVKGLQDLQSQFTALASAMKANQSVQAAGMVGRNVLVAGDAGVLPKDGGPMVAAVDLPQGADRLRIDVVAPGGALVKQLDLGRAQAGRVDFGWDGKVANGSRVPPGLYKLKVHAQINGQEVAAGSMVQTRVDSVSFGSAGELTLNLASLGSFDFDAVKEIR